MPACALFACGLPIQGREEASDTPDGGVDAPLPPNGDGSDDAGPTSDGDAAADAPEEGVDAGPTTILTTTVAAVSLQQDCATWGDGSIKTDGYKDGVFDVVISGPFIAVALIRTAPSPTDPNPYQQW